MLTCQDIQTTLTLAGWIGLVLKLQARDFGKKTEENVILCWSREGSLGRERSMVSTVIVISCLQENQMKKISHACTALGLL